MQTSDDRAQHGHRLVQLGMFLFLLALLVGLAVPKFAVPRLGLSTHLLGIMQGLFLMIAGLLWPTLRFSSLMSRIGIFLAVYGCFAAWTANLTAAIIGAGNSLLPIAAGQAQGTAGRRRIRRLDSMQHVRVSIVEKHAVLRAARAAASK